MSFLPSLLSSAKSTYAALLAPAPPSDLDRTLHVLSTRLSAPPSSLPPSPSSSHPHPSDPQGKGDQREGGRDRPGPDGPERSAAIRSLKGLAHDWPLPVAKHAGPSLIALLADSHLTEQDTRAVLETLSILAAPQKPLPSPSPLTPPSSHPPPHNHNHSSTEVEGDPEQSARQTTAALLSIPSFLPTLLSLLSPPLNQSSGYTTLYTLQLLGRLAALHPADLPPAFLLPGPSTALLALLGPPSTLQEKPQGPGQGQGHLSGLVRAEAVLLLRDISLANGELQKLLAFQGAFEGLLGIALEQGGLEAASVPVSDALAAVLALLEHNPSNQVLFFNIYLLCKMLINFDLDRERSERWTAFTSCRRFSPFRCTSLAGWMPMRFSTGPRPAPMSHRACSASSASSPTTPPPPSPISFVLSLFKKNHFVSVVCRKASRAAD